ncbi:MAG: HD domain-containing protein [Deltaproteobacteria bacterium]|nr:HD domain-containing protein [Deltaproteobacteria bacterium]
MDGFSPSTKINREENMQTTRREFVKLSAVATASAAFLNDFAAVAGAGAPLSPDEAVSLEECQGMDYLKMAETSPLVRNSWNYLRREISGIKDPGIRALTEDIYGDSTPRLSRDRRERGHIWKELSAAGYTGQSLENVLPPLPADMRSKYPYIASPGSGYGSHHAYPGGLVTHVAANVKITEAIVNTYVEIYGYSVNRDIAVAAQLLHDLHKPYVFQWLDDASSRAEPPLAGAGEHHVLSGAELLARKAPAELVVAQICAHTHPGTDEEEKKVVAWLKAAAVIAGVDPVRYGLLDKNGETLPRPRKQEGFICHLGDHDFVLSVPAVQWTLPVLREIARSDYKLSARDLDGKPFNSLRNLIFSRISAMRLEHLYAQGREQLRAAVHAVVKPV